IIPGYKGIDFAIIILAFVLEVIALSLIVWLRLDHLPRMDGTLLWALGTVLNQIIDILFYALIIRVILSWLGVTLQNPFYEIVYLLTEPLLKPIRRFVPLIANFDFSPIIVAIIVKFIGIVLIVPLIRIGQIIALGKFLH